MKIVLKFEHNFTYMILPLLNFLNWDFMTNSQKREK
jgi:hypothetical protein